MTDLKAAVAAFWQVQCRKEWQKQKQAVEHHSMTVPLPPPPPPPLAGGGGWGGGKGALGRAAGSLGIEENICQCLNVGAVHYCAWDSYMRWTESGEEVPKYSQFPDQQR